MPTYRVGNLIELEGSEVPPVLYVIGYLSVVLLVFMVFYQVFKKYGGREEDALVMAFFWPIFLPICIVGALGYVLITYVMGIVRRIK